MKITVVATWDTEHRRFVYENSFNLLQLDVQWVWISTLMTLLMSYNWIPFEPPPPLESTREYTRQSPKFWPKVPWRGAETAARECFSSPPVATLWVVLLCHGFKRATVRRLAPRCHAPLEYHPATRTGKRWGKVACWYDTLKEPYKTKPKSHVNINVIGTVEM